MRRPEPRQIIPRGDGGGASAELLRAEELAGAEVAQRKNKQGQPTHKAIVRTSPSPINVRSLVMLLQAD